MTGDRAAVLARVTEDAVVELALALGNIDSAAGAETEAAEYVHEWLSAAGFASRKVGLTDERFNVVGRLPGTGGGCALAFNSHLDTSVAAHEQWSTRFAGDPVYHSAWRDGDVLVGNGVCNDKGQMAAWLIAAKALKEAGVELAGDLVLTAVCGEIELEPVDEFGGPGYASRDLGTRYALGHGAVADFAVVAEATDFRLGYVQAGSAFFKLSVLGGEPPTYTPFLGARGGASPNAIVRLAEVIVALEQWGAEYERRHRHECDGGVVVPRVSVGAVRGGLPYKITKTAQNASAYVDVRLTPVQRPLDVKAELAAFLHECGVDFELELFASRRGYEATGIEPLAAGVATAHREVFGDELGPVEDPSITSMWRDLNCYAEAGIPCIIYGPGPSTGHGAMAIRVGDLVQAARAYALIALEVTATPRTQEHHETLGGLAHG
jgi:acetylornithine deacetylase/succinyl-diaminopimelate desuccinylase-like protein